MKKILCATLLFLSVDLYAYEPSAAENIFPYQTAVAKDSAALPLINPSMLPWSHGAFISSSFARPYSIDGLNAIFVKGGFSHNSMGISCGWTRFGITEYYEDRFLAGAGFSPFRCISFGAEGFMQQNVIATDVVRSKTDLFDANLFMTLAPHNFLRIGFRQDNIGSIFSKKRRDLLQRAARSQLDSLFGHGCAQHAVARAAPEEGL